MSKTRSANPLPGACDPEEIALKSFFLGPQAENADWVIHLVQNILGHWAKWRRELYPDDGNAISPANQITPEFLDRKAKFEGLALDLFKRFEAEVPKFSPRYVGHMFSEVSLPALVGHVIALLHNPNNISGESSKVGIQIEHEAIRFLLGMVGFPVETGMGHFTSGGTIANLEALTRAHARCALWMSQGWVARTREQSGLPSPFECSQMGWEEFDRIQATIRRSGITESEVREYDFSRGNPHRVYGRIEKTIGSSFDGPVILVPQNKHYSWKKGVRILGMGDESLWPIELDRTGRLSVRSLQSLIARARREERPISLVVSVMGTTELGSIDPVHEVQDLLDDFARNEGIHIWHHVDAAYGGFFRAMNVKDSPVLSSDATDALKAVPRATSITLDPHKLGYVPYASGAFLARGPRDYYFSTFDDAPYIDFDTDRDLGPYTIEGSRSAAGAVATWLTAKSVGLDEHGYGLLLERTIRIRQSLERKLAHSEVAIRISPFSDTNILCFACGEKGEPLSAVNARTLRVYEKFSSQARGPFIVSKTVLKWDAYGNYLDAWLDEWKPLRDSNEVVLIRMCLMNPFFESVETKVNYAESFIEALKAALAETGK
jgi:glutamate/tyrosine decarboxylase-like PLP-dependent enzyme